MYFSHYIVVCARFSVCVCARERVLFFCVGI